MNRFYSAPTCSPTSCFFTGLNSLTNGIIRPLNNPTAERYALSLEHKIMPEYFKDGYKTALSGKWHLECTKMNTCQEIEVLIQHMVIWAVV